MAHTSDGTAGSGEDRARDVETHASRAVNHLAYTVRVPTTRTVVPIKAPTPPPRVDELVTLVSPRAKNEGPNETSFPGVRLYRFSAPARFNRMTALGPTLTVVAQGRKVVRLGTTELMYDPECYCVVSGESKFDATILEATGDLPFLSVCIEFSSDAVVKTLLALSEADVPATREDVPAFVSPLDPPFKSALMRLLPALDDQFERKFVAPLIMEELVLRLLRTDAASVLRSLVARDAESDSIQKAMRFMRENAARPLTVEAIARHVAMSPSHFAHRFRTIARVSPMRYLKEIRIHEARAQLLTNGLRVNEAATRVGYESVSHFVRDFKTYFGAPPSAYSKRFRSD